MSPCVDLPSLVTDSGTSSSKCTTQRRVSRAYGIFSWFYGKPTFYFEIDNLGQIDIWEKNIELVLESGSGLTQAETKLNKSMHESKVEMEIFKNHFKWYILLWVIFKQSMWKSFNQFQQFQWIPVTDVTRIFEIFQFRYTIFICDINLDLTGNRIQHFWLQIVFKDVDCHWSPFRISSKKESFIHVEERFIDCIQCFIHHFYQFFDFFVIWVICRCEWLLISNRYLLYGWGLKKSIWKPFPYNM